MLAAVLSAVSRCLIVATLLLSLGGGWHVLQVVAWAKMVEERAPIMGYENAFESVVAGTMPCFRCVALREQREHQKESPLAPERTLVKTTFIPAVVVEFRLAPPTATRVSLHRYDVAPPWTIELDLPSPPPRGA